MLSQNGTISDKKMFLFPEAPAYLTGDVKAWRGPVEILTYEPEHPDRNPMFLEKRVYQGSSGRVYPLPFIDRIAAEPSVRRWDAIHIENEFIRLMILPEIGGRIHIGYDKINDYDFFYKQNVIKPALVGLAGPWASGGVEFNWPQHHRPATFMPVRSEIEQGEDGSVTVWCSDHDPMLRMKGMHGVCLRPGQALVELRARLFNRTEFTQTFLWWANVATRVHERYQSFFPTDVRYVADHARRAVTSFPLSDRPYYGVDYPGRAEHGVPDHEKPSHFHPDGTYAPNDLSWYANIPVPTSYMVMATSGDFFGGYDHATRAGLVHVANHHIAPGKKQWTWGNHEFGYAWDRSLTDADGPYIELMAGVYTENQPDFSYLAPWETKTFSQYWYPIREIGVPQAANTTAAMRIAVERNVVHLMIEVTRPVENAVVELLLKGNVLGRWETDLNVTKIFQVSMEVDPSTELKMVSARFTQKDRIVLFYDPAMVVPAKPPVAAKEPAPPGEIASVEELYLTGLHLDQYRHATRDPQLYWDEALRRDACDSRTLNAYGLWWMRRGQFGEARECFYRATERLTTLNPNPRDGEAFYSLGQSLRFMGEDGKAYDAFYKATWNAAWRAPAYLALAELDSIRSEWLQAEDHLRRSLRAEADNLNARNLLSYVVRQQGRHKESEVLRGETLALDPLDIGAHWDLGEAPVDAQEVLDLVFDLLRAGRKMEVIAILEDFIPRAADSAAPVLEMLSVDLQSDDQHTGEAELSAKFERFSMELCFPHRLEELLLLERITAAHPKLWAPWYLMGNLLYDKRRHFEAVACWERATKLAPFFPTVWRNLGIAYFNVYADAEKASAAYDRAFDCDHTDGRVLYERDQLWKRIGRSPERRLGEFKMNSKLVSTRDDLAVEWSTLYNQTGNPQLALDVLASRQFQPWEGGEGLVLGQYVRAHLLLGQSALEQNDACKALEHFKAALEAPTNLSEAKHLLANQSDVYFWIGTGYASSGHSDLAKQWFTRATLHQGDFQQMSVVPVSEMTFWNAVALRHLGLQSEANAKFEQMLDFAHALDRSEPKIDYFATSLPTMLLFEEDLAARNHVGACFLRALGLLGLGRTKEAEADLRAVLLIDSNHAGAGDLLAHWDKLVKKEMSV